MCAADYLHRYDPTVSVSMKDVKTFSVNRQNNDQVGTYGMRIATY